MNSNWNALKYYRGTMVIDSEPDWKLLALGINRFANRRQEKFAFENAIENENGTFELPFHLSAHVSLSCSEYENDSHSNNGKSEKKVEIALVEPQEDKNKDENESKRSHLSPRNNRPRFQRLTEEEASQKFQKKVLEEIEGFFGYKATLCELFPDFLHLEDLQEVEGAFEESSGGSPFMMRFKNLEEDEIKPLTNNHEGSLGLEQLNALIGMDAVKRQVRDLVALVQKHGRDVLPCLHMVFRGNPGTGKTTVARIIGKIFDEMNITSGDGVFVETDREGLIAKYVGHTAIKTKKKIKEAQGGVLFIDEAYALSHYSESKVDFGEEAMSTLVREMENHRDEFICIMAGYPKEMDRLIDMNPGLRDRVGFYIDFPDYSVEELCDIFQLFVHDAGFRLSSKSKKLVQEVFEAVVACKDENFSNGRIVRKIFERVRMAHLLSDSKNVIKEESILKAIESEDLRGIMNSESTSSIGFCI